MTKFWLQIFLFILLAYASSCSCNKTKDNPTNYIESSNRKFEGQYTIKELQISPSPQGPTSIDLKAGEKLLSFSVSPSETSVAALLENGTKYEIRFWNAKDADFSGKIDIDGDLIPTELAYHPEGTCVFVAGTKNGKSHIVKYFKDGSSWKQQVIYTTESKLKNILVGPRPFLTGSSYAYRLFFGESIKNDSYHIMSVTEDGTISYQAADPKETATEFKDEKASYLFVDYALPVSFYPSGERLIFRDKNDNLIKASYHRSWDDKTFDLKNEKVNKGSLTIEPNEIVWLQWSPQKAGIGVYIVPKKQLEFQALNYKFISQPYASPDGKGALGVCMNNGKYSIKYVPLKIPLADVINASMFISNAAEFDLCVQNDGMFVPRNYDQLYQLYETENYYGEDSPMRPYLVTTDIFWEMFGAAYEGLFIVKERNECMPKFWSFVSKAQTYFNQSKPNSKWAVVFNSLINLKENKNEDIEVKRMLSETEIFCELIDTLFNYSDLKVRGHYSSSPDLTTYFKAFKYFTSIFKHRQSWMPELNSLPADAKNDALDWIKSYKGFIASSRSPLVWDGLSNEVPAYCQHPNKNMSLFPLSWGFDNEVLFSTIYHRKLPPEETVIDAKKQGRDFPSGLDIVAAFGNSFADSLLENQYKEYPVLKNVIRKLQENFKKNGICKDDNLYGKWLNALALQWCDTVKSANGDAKQKIWQTKRIQTGLASWTTLRHATCLVNEVASAESGEGGFEEMIARTPRGYVEPDPQTFEAIAVLFETMIKHLPADIKKLTDVSGVHFNEKSNSDLYNGLTERLKNSAKEIREFKVMAEKQKKGIQLTDQEYDKITGIATVAEHYFLVFKSLANKDLALSKPDPMSKIIDVSNAPASPNNPNLYLLSAVGKPIEWDYIVPFYGRHEMVKGSIYSYYEFQSQTLMNDKEWNAILPKQPFLPWIKPFILPVDLNVNESDQYFCKHY